MCFSGHRKLPSAVELDKLYNRLLIEVKRACDEGYTHFIFGGAEGFDLLAASAVIETIRDYEGIKLTAAIPFKGHTSNFSLENIEQYHSVINKCSSVITLSNTFNKLCFKKRNQYMVDNSSRLISYYNGSYRTGTGQTVRMAMKQELDIVNIYY